MNAMSIEYGKYVCPRCGYKGFTQLFDCIYCNGRGSKFKVKV